MLENNKLVDGQGPALADFENQVARDVVRLVALQQFEMACVIIRQRIGPLRLKMLHNEQPVNDPRFVERPPIASDCGTVPGSLYGRQCDCVHGTLEDGMLR